MNSYSNPYSVFPFLTRGMEISINMIMLIIVYSFMYISLEIMSSMSFGWFIFDMDNRIFGYRAARLFIWAAMLSYILSTSVIIPPNKVGIQTCMGRIVRGGEMSPGFHMLPIFPIPFLGFICALLSVSYPLGYGVLKTENIVEKQQEVKKTLTIYTQEKIQLILSFVFQFSVNMAEQEIVGTTTAQEFVKKALKLFSDSAIATPPSYIEICQKEVHMPPFVDLAHSLGVDLQSIFIEHISFANIAVENIYERLLADKVSEENLLRHTRELALLRKTLGDTYSENDIVMLYAGYVFANN